jgi:hypothetical protein
MMRCHIVTPVSSNFLLKNWIQARNFGCGLFFCRAGLGIRARLGFLLMSLSGCTSSSDEANSQVVELSGCYFLGMFRIRH